MTAPTFSQTFAAQQEYSGNDAPYVGYGENFVRRIGLTNDVPWSVYFSLVP
jgi:hypothetical protein